MAMLTIHSKTVYTCSDGKEFDDQETAQKHEAVQMLDTCTGHLGREELLTWVLERFEPKASWLKETPSGKVFLNTPHSYFL